MVMGAVSEIRGGHAEEPSSEAEALAETARPDISALMQVPGVALRLAYMHIARLHAPLARGDPLTPNELQALAVIRDNPGVRLTAVAEVLVMRTPNMTKLVGSLIEKGLVRREPRLGDGRARALFLTPKGQGLQARLGAEARAYNRSAIAVLSARERKILLRLLNKLVDDLSVRRGIIDR